MLTSVLLTAALSLSASPAAYDNAQAHQSYQIIVTSDSSSTMNVQATLAPDASCSIELSRKPTWASMSGPTSFTLAPHQARTFVVSVGQPPPGQSELIAAFVASDPSPNTGAKVSAGVGTALRFSEPGHTVITPCPKPKPTKGNVRTIVVGASNIKPASNAGLDFALGGFGGVVILALLTFLFLRYRRPRGQHR